MTEWQQAYGGFARRVLELRSEAFERNKDAYSEFVGRMNGASDDANPARSAQEAYIAGLESAQRVANETSERYDKAASELSSAWREIQDAAGRRSADAYRTYLRGVQEEWAAVDVDSLVGTSGMG